MKKNNIFAITFMLLNCFLAASMATLACFFEDIPTFSLISGYNAVTFIFIFIILKYKNIPIKTQQPLLNLQRSFLNTLAYYLYFKALSLTSLANVAVISYTDPILTCLAAYLILKEKITKTQITELVIGFICALIIINPISLNFNKGAILVLCATILWSLSNVTMKKMGETENELVQIFFVSFITTLLAGLFAILRNEQPLLDIHFFKGIGIIGIFAIMQYYAVYKALTSASSGVIMPFFFTTLIFSSIYGYIFFGEIQQTHEMIGSFILIFMNIWQIYKQRSR